VRAGMADILVLCTNCVGSLIRVNLATA